MSSKEIYNYRKEAEKARDLKRQHDRKRKRETAERFNSSIAKMKV